MMLVVFFFVVRSDATIFSLRISIPFGVCYLSHSVSFRFVPFCFCFTYVVVILTNVLS